MKKYIAVTGNIRLTDMGMKKLKLQKNNNNRKGLLTGAPLFSFVVISTLILSLAGLYQSTGKYLAYRQDEEAAPVGLVMMGLSDGIMPWPDEVTEYMCSLPERFADSTPADTGNKDSGTTDNESAILSGEPDELFSTGKTKEKKEKKLKPIKKAGGHNNTGESADDLETANDTTKADNAEIAANAKTTDEAGAAADTETKADAPFTIEDKMALIPKDSICEVCGAHDYGIANTRYRAPSDWEIPADQTGLFAVGERFKVLSDVDEDYFKDALYIGDSRVDGLCDYGGFDDEMTFACRDSLTIFKLFEGQLRYRAPGGIRGYHSLEQILAYRTYGKIYIQLGINEVGTKTTKEYYEEYRKTLEKIHAVQPTALLFIDGMMHVTASKSSSDSVFTNVNLVERNRAVSTLANGNTVFYIDMNPAVCDENGNLKQEYSMDHAHLKARSHDKWREFLMSHGAVSRVSIQEDD